MEAPNYFGKKYELKEISLNFENYTVRWNISIINNSIYEGLNVVECLHRYTMSRGLHLSKDRVKGLYENILNNPNSNITLYDFDICSIGGTKYLIAKNINFIEDSKIVELVKTKINKDSYILCYDNRIKNRVQLLYLQ